MCQNGAEIFFVQMIKIIYSKFCPYSLRPIQDIQTKRARKTYTSAKSDFCDDTNLHIKIKSSFHKMLTGFDAYYRFPAPFTSQNS